MSNQNTIEEYAGEIYNGINELFTINFAITFVFRENMLGLWLIV